MCDDLIFLACGGPFYFCYYRILSTEVGMRKQLFVEVIPAYAWQATPGYLSGRFVERILTAVISFRQQQQNVLGFLTEACQALDKGMSFPSLVFAVQ